MSKQTRLANFLTLGLTITLISILSSCASEVCGWSGWYMFQTTNKTDSVIYFNHFWTSDVKIHTRCIMPPHEPSTEIYSEDVMPPYETDEYMTIEFCDSVIEIRPMVTDESGISQNVFSFRNVGDEDNYEYYYEFTDDYITEIADTMRKLGVEPYRLNKEVVRNSSSQDFTLGIVTPGKTYTYEVSTGEETEIEMKWLMESEDTCGLHKYEFAFRDSTLTVYPAEIGYDKRLHRHRFFSAETTREGGGKRTYEITDKMFSEMDKEMRKLKEARPEMFE